MCRFIGVPAPVMSVVLELLIYIYIRPHMSAACSGMQTRDHPEPCGTLFGKVLEKI